MAHSYKEYTYESGVSSVKENGTNHYVYLNLNDACVEADSSIPPYSQIGISGLKVFADSSTSSNDAAFKVSLTNSNGSTTYLSNFISGTQDGNGSSITNYTEFDYSIDGWFHSKNASAGHINGFGGTGTYLQCHFNLYVLVKHTFAAKYTLKFAYYTPDVTVTVTGDTGGTVTGGGTYNYGKTYTITATPATGYKFVKWSDGDTNASRTFTVNDSIITAYETKKSYHAVFEKLSYEISTGVSPTGSGTVSGGGTYEYGTKPTLTATPSAGYKFVKWSDGVTTASRTVTVTGAATYTATFELDKINKIYVDTTQPKGIYVDETNKKIVFVINGTVSTPNSSVFDTLDGYHIVVQNTVPSGMDEIKEVYVDTTKVYG